MNFALIQDGYLPAVIPPILRKDYVFLLERAHREAHDFIEFIAERRAGISEGNPAAVSDPFLKWSLECQEWN